MLLFLFFRVSNESQNLLLHSFYFVSLLNLVIPAKPVFTGNQFAYFDEQFTELILTSAEPVGDAVAVSLALMGFASLPPPMAS